MEGNFTLFKSDASSGAGSLAYDQDTFNDISLPATNNTTLTSTTATNPLGDFFNDNDAPRYGVKTLFVKDMVLEQDRNKWVNSKPTYRIIWSENAPFASGYVAGNPQFVTDPRYNNQIAMLDVNDLAGVTSTARRMVFLVYPSTAATNTILINVDGAGSSTYNVGGTAAGTLADKSGFRAHTIACETTNETNDLHDFRIISQTQGAVKLVGVRIYFENANANIQTPPGSTYNNKNKVTTSSGSSLGLPSVGSSLGGRSLIYKTLGSGYQISTNAVPMQQTVGTGNNNATTINVTTGHGGSFPAGTVIAGFYGSSPYMGAVQSVSTDTLTVTPAVYPTSGISGPLYRLAFGGQSANIGSTQYLVTSAIGSSQFIGQYDGVVADTEGKYYLFWESGSTVVGATLYYGASNFMQSGSNALRVNGSSSYIKVEGYFAAADMVISGASINGVGTFGGTFYVNGFPTWSSSGQALTGMIRVPLMTNGAPGWNSVLWGFGGTFNSLTINQINLYANRFPQGVSFGQLAYFDTLPAFIDQSNSIIGATFMAYGNWRRIPSQQLPVVTGGSQNGDNFFSTRHYVPMSAATDGFTLVFYGKNIALGGTFSSGTTVKIDGTGIASAQIWGRTYTNLSEGFHTLQVSMAAGSTTLIGHVDISKGTGDLFNLQKYANEAIKVIQNTYGSSGAPVVPPEGRNLSFADCGSNFQTSSITPVDVTNLSIIHTCKGGPVVVLLVGSPNFTGSRVTIVPGGISGAETHTLLNRDGVILQDSRLYQIDTVEMAVPISMAAVDFPGIGTHTYKVQLNTTNASSTSGLDHGRLIVYELN